MSIGSDPFTIPGGEWREIIMDLLKEMKSSIENHATRMDAMDKDFRGQLVAINSNLATIRQSLDNHRSHEDRIRKLEEFINRALGFLVALNLAGWGAGLLLQYLVAK